MSGRQARWFYGSLHVASLTVSYLLQHFGEINQALCLVVEPHSNNLVPLGAIANDDLSVRYKLTIICLQVSADEKWQVSELRNTKRVLIVIDFPH